MTELKFNYVWTLLSKSTDDSILQKADSKGRNLFHNFARVGSHCPIILAKKIYKEFINKKINFQIQDNEGQTPLHLAASTGFRFLVNKFLKAKVDPNTQDK
mmetsp:Transcript_41580/g.36965  ORF Transcript_41580/g.36965 Transcript_41580/m.36965 type:complete len:101 (+) Transcript_41580:171-473(+)